MNISLTPELEKFVQDKVACGMYTSASEVIRESLRLLNTYEDVQKQRIGQLQHAIDIGMQDIESQNVIGGNESREKMKAKLSKMKKDN